MLEILNVEWAADSMDSEHSACASDILESQLHRGKTKNVSVRLKLCHLFSIASCAWRNVVSVLNFFVSVKNVAHVIVIRSIIIASFVIEIVVWN